MMATGVHFYLNWAKERMDEMDAVVTSLEGKASELTAQSRAAADRLIADLRQQRDAFLVDMPRRGEAGGAAWIGAKAEMENDRKDLPTNGEKISHDFRHHVQQQATNFLEI